MYIKSDINTPKSRNKADLMPFLILVSKIIKKTGPNIMLSNNPSPTPPIIKSINFYLF